MAGMVDESSDGRYYTSEHMDDAPPTPSPRRHRWLAVALPAVLFAGGFLTWWFRFDTYHLVTVHEGVLYRDGNRGLREFRNALRKTNAKTVVCIVDDEEIKAAEYLAEQELLRRKGVAFVRIPIVKGDWPTT